MRSRARGTVAVVLGAVLAAAGAQAATKTVDLDGKTTNGAESAVDLNVLQSFPAKIEAKVTNRTGGDAFTFKWLSAGPGGFTSSLTAGTAGGVGTKWVWTTNQTIYAFTGTTCTKDVCFTKTAGPDPVTSRGPFSVPGRSLLRTDVTVSSASLTSSLVTFFSPPQEVFRATSSAAPSTSGVAFRETLTNPTDDPITVAVAAYPPGCCNEPGRINCDGECFDWRTDAANCGGCGIACGAGEYCSEGTCVQSCPAGTTLCDGVCVDLQNDPANCGACGNSCGENQICTGGACLTCRPPEQTACNNRCVNVHTDAENCGACNVDCNTLCPSSGQGACSQGQSCFCLPGGGGSTIALSLPVDEAPVCEVPASETTVPAGASVTDCSVRNLLAKEVPTLVTVCGDGLPTGEALCPDGSLASEGIFMKLVPDLTKPVGDAFVTPFAVRLDDASKDGLLQPGETAKVKIEVLNAGPVAIKGAFGTLKSPPVDLTDDGVNNPVSATIGAVGSAYAEIVGTPAGTADCSSLPPLRPSANVTAFQVGLPASHPGDVTRPFVLTVTGTVGGVPFAADVPLNIGIADRCDPTARTGDYDGVDGLLTPMARLAPEGDVVPFPDKPFALGKSRPLKLRMLCGGVNLTGADVDAPEIIGLSEAVLGPLDITRLSLNDDGPNSKDPFFRYNATGKQWIYNMRTSDLAAGTYTLTLRIASRKAYVTGFVLK